MHSGVAYQNTYGRNTMLKIEMQRAIHATKGN